MIIISVYVVFMRTYIHSPLRLTRRSDLPSNPDFPIFLFRGSISILHPLSRYADDILISERTLILPNDWCSTPYIVADYFLCRYDTLYTLDHPIFSFSFTPNIDSKK